MLPQPISDRLTDSKRILLAGAGGGYDVLGAVPLLPDLLGYGCDLVLANNSFTALATLPGASPDPDLPNLYSIPAQSASEDVYCPESWLAKWCAEELGQDIPVWAFAKTGVGPLHAAYEKLIAQYEIDTIVLIDGGIDAILRGDESSLGTPSEDLTTLCAVARLDVPSKLIACVGFGAEMRDGICHEQAFGRISELTAKGGHLGTASVLSSTEAGRRYLEATDYVFAHQAGLKTSHIHKVVAQAVRGEGGSRGEHIWLSPLLNLMWFFDLGCVTSTHLFLEHLWGTTEAWEISARVEGFRKDIDVLDRSSIPI